MEDDLYQCKLDLKKIKATVFDYKDDIASHQATIAELKGLIASSKKIHLTNQQDDKLLNEMNRTTKELEMKLLKAVRDKEEEQAKREQERRRVIELSKQLESVDSLTSLTGKYSKRRSEQCSYNYR